MQDWPKTLTLFHLYRKALLQSEGYQKSQLARAAIQHSVTQAAEADQAVVEEASHRQDMSMKNACACP